jgi:hypothetical protein
MQSRRSANSKTKLLKACTTTILVWVVADNFCARSCYSIDFHLIGWLAIDDFSNTNTRQRVPRSCFHFANLGNNKLFNSARSFCGRVWKVAITTTNSLFHPIYICCFEGSHLQIYLLPTASWFIQKAAFSNQKISMRFINPNLRDELQIQSKDRGRRTEWRIWLSKHLMTGWHRSHSSLFMISLIYHDSKNRLRWLSLIYFCGTQWYT